MAYDTTIEHIKGSLNEVAYTFSRLCKVDAHTNANDLYLLHEFKVIAVARSDLSPHD